MYGQFTASSSIRLRSSQNNISADTDPAGRDWRTIEGGIHSADLHRLPRVRERTAIRLGQDAKDQDLASCSAYKRVSASRSRIAVAIRALTSSPAIHGFQNQAQRRALGEESCAETAEHSRR